MDKPPVRPSATATSSRPAPASRNVRDATDSHDDKQVILTDDGLVDVLRQIIHFTVKVLAVLMTLVIFWSSIDVFYTIYERALANPYFLLGVSDLLAVFGAFMTVLIAIEIFINITLYLRHDALPIKMVIATALMAVARKVIMLDVKDIDPQYLLALAAVIVALGVTYWLISYKPAPIKQPEER